MYYGWLVVALAFCAALIGAGMRAAPTVFILPFESEFGWSRAAIAASISVNLLLFGLGAPVSGRLIDKFGLRPVISGNLIALAVAAAISTQINALWQLSLLWGIVIGLAAGGGSVLSATVATRWFAARRGLVVGLLGTSTSTGQVMFIPLLMWITVTLGWRGATALLACLAALILIPVVIFMRNDPAQVGLKPYGADSPEAARQRARGGDDEPAVPLLEALKTRDFWLLAGSFFVCGATSNGLIGTHLIPYSVD